MSQSERRLAAIMYTDMVGYTALGQRNESLSLALVEEQRKQVRPILARHQGREVKTMGDAFLVEFLNALEAVRCAYDIQRAMREFNFTLSNENRAILRVGVHVGDVVESQGDISGDAVNIASRIGPLAEDGGVCLTQQVYDQVNNKFELPFQNLGSKKLKNISSPLQVYRMVMPWDEGTTSSIQLDRRRIAVLPFANMSSDPEDEYLAEGMMEELISAISNIGGLSAISRTSAMKFKGGGKTAFEIGNELRTGTLLEGSVRKSGNKIRIMAQLVDVNEDRHLWSERYDRELDDIFEIQDDIAGKIADALQVKFTTRPEVAQGKAENIEAYTFYLKGRSLWNTRTKEGVLGAKKLFEEAIRIDPTYAVAYSGLADAYVIAAVFNYMDVKEGFMKGRAALSKALELDDALPEAHASLGRILLNEFKFQEAEKQLRKAIGLNRNYATAHQWLSQCLVELGDLDGGIKEVSIARELDPLSPVITNLFAEYTAFAGRIEEGIAILDKLTEREPAFGQANLLRFIFMVRKKMKAEAIIALDRYRRFRDDEESYKLRLSRLHSYFGETDEARRLIQEVLRETKGSPRDPAVVAFSYGALGEKDEFFSWVDKAIEAKDFSVAYLRYSPFCDKMKDDPRFPEIFRKLGLPYD